MIYVYGKEHCPACRQTEMFLNRNAIQYVYKKVVDDNGNPLDDEATKLITYFKQRGYKQFPVVNITRPDGSKDEWSGFRPDKLKQTVDLVVDK